MSMTARLQAHYNKLQEYLSDWNDTQQRLLTEVCTRQQELVDSMNTMRVCDIEARAPSHEHETVPDEHDTVPSAQWQAVPCPAFEETELAKGGETGALCNILPNSDSDRAFLVSTPEDHMQSRSDAEEHGPLEEFRMMLVKRFEMSLGKLKGLVLPTSDDMASWLTTTLDALEEQMAQVDVLALPDEQQGALPEVPEVPAIPDEGHHEVWTRKIQHSVGKVIHSFHFESITAGVIVVNAILMGISADTSIKGPDEPQNDFLEVMELVFVIYYILEICFRMSHSIKIFFMGPDWYWNDFDVVLVVFSLFDQVIHLFQSDGNPLHNISFFRVMRLLKLARLLRTVRLMKICKNLRLILASISGSLPAMLPATFLMIVVSYTASVLFVSLLANFLSDAEEQSFDISLEIRQYIEDYWSSVLTGMITLFGATTGGDDWFNISAPLEEAGWACYAAFLIYMTFFIIVILNTFSSLFVHSVMEYTAKDDQAIIDLEMEKREHYVAKLKDFYQAIDDNHDGMMEMDEFIVHAKDPQFLAWASMLDMDMADAVHVFEVLSRNGSMRLTLESFVEACIRVRGQAKSVDLMSLYQLSQTIHKRLDQCFLMVRANKRHDEGSQTIQREIADFKRGCFHKLTNMHEEIADLKRTCLQKEISDVSWMEKSNGSKAQYYAL